MRVVALTHGDNVGPGVFADAIAAGGHELVEWQVPRRAQPPEGADAVIVLGGAMHPDQEERHGWLRDELRLLRRLHADGVPLLGVCLGGQLLAKALDAPVRRMPSAEVGWFDVSLTEAAAADPVFGGLPGRFASFQWHTYRFELPAGAVELARNDRCVQAFRAGPSTWAIQFHAEVTRASVEDWVRTTKPEDDGVVDFPALLAETDEQIAGWNALGIGLCRRFLAAAAGA
jgi:GMP synthase-like glutamine amidotransferase